MARLLTLTALLVAGLAVGPPDLSALLLGVAAVLVAGAVGARHAARALDAARPRTGVRAEAHRQLLDALPAPRHPRTAGRPSPRAPSGAASTV